VPGAASPAGHRRRPVGFGRAIRSGLPSVGPIARRSLLCGLGAVTVNERLIASEKIGARASVSGAASSCRSAVPIGAAAVSSSVSTSSSWPR